MQKAFPYFTFCLLFSLVLSVPVAASGETNIDVPVEFPTLISDETIAVHVNSNPEILQLTVDYPISSIKLPELMDYESLVGFTCDTDIYMVQALPGNEGISIQYEVHVNWRPGGDFSGCVLEFSAADRRYTAVIYMDYHGSYSPLEAINLLKEAP